MAVHHPAKDQMGSSYGSVQWLGHQVGERIGLKSLAAKDARQRMQENRQSKRIDTLKDGLEQRIVKVMALNVRPHVNAAYSRELAHAVEFLNSAIGIEHGQGRQN